MNVEKNGKVNSLMAHFHDGACSDACQRSDIVDGCNSTRCHEGEVSSCQMLLRTESTIIHYCGK